MCFRGNFIRVSTVQKSQIHVVSVLYLICSEIYLFIYLLAHLSRRLIGELIGYVGLCRTSVVHAF